MGLSEVWWGSGRGLEGVWLESCRVLEGVWQGSRKRCSIAAPLGVRSPKNTELE